MVPGAVVSSKGVAPWPRRFGSRPVPTRLRESSEASLGRFSGKPLKDVIIVMMCMCVHIVIYIVTYTCIVCVTICHVYI